MLLVAVASTAVNMWHGIRVTGFRSKAKVPYPNAYASHEDSDKSIEKYQFNCAQRAHANYLENYPDFLVTLAVAGLKYPEVSAGLGAVYLVSRIFYALGYARPVRDGGKGRYNGITQYFGKMGLLGLSFVSAYKLLA